jgi:hypothetical protein
VSVSSAPLSDDFDLKSPERLQAVVSPSPRLMTIGSVRAGPLLLGV